MRLENQVLALGILDTDAGRLGYFNPRRRERRALISSSSEHHELRNGTMYICICTYAGGLLFVHPSITEITPSKIHFMNQTSHSSLHLPPCLSSFSYPHIPLPSHHTAPRSLTCSTLFTTRSSKLTSSSLTKPGPSLWMKCPQPTATIGPMHRPSLVMWTRPSL